jgi:nitrate reductase cytochrome c-type subunit
MRTAIIVYVALATVACGGAAQQQGVPADQIGLSKVGISEVPDPPVVAEDTTEPGERTPGPAAFAGAPPVVSHGIADFTPITPEDNMCLDCHAVEEKVEGEPTPVPESHYVDLRNRPDVVNSEIAGARYVCTSCHVATTDAAPLVENTFGS